MRYLKTGTFVEPKPLTKEEMFSDEMPERNNDFIVTGDTDSIFCCFQSFKNITVENVIKWCSQLEEFLNEDKIKTVTEIHNVSPSYNRLKLKNELVISRGLFLAKKRYAIRVISNEGKSVDKINYMGVEIKRSDFPSQSKKFLAELTELILKSEKFNFGKIFQFISNKEKEFIKLIQEGNKQVARPVSFGKSIKQYKTIPQGVRAMLAWNKIMYNIHNKGSRAYMFWVRGIDFDKIANKDQKLEIRKKYEKFIEEGNKLEVVAIPDEETKLPDFFIPDVQKTLKFVFVDRYELLLKPLTEVKKQMELLTI
jgi:DNA polymerase elongation subunit (family B)